MTHGKKRAWDEYARWSKDDLQRYVGFMRRFNTGFNESGVFVDTKRLAWPQEAKIVRSAFEVRQVLGSHNDLGF
jgi:hypothetical protein